jgi:hypothetical protein
MRSEPDLPPFPELLNSQPSTLNYEVPRVRAARAAKKREREKNGNPNAKSMAKLVS